MLLQPAYLAGLHLHGNVFKHLPGHWTWHRMLRLLDPLHWLLAPLLGAGLVAFRTFLQRLRERRAANWPATEAIVLSASVKANNGWWVEIDYRFFARDEYRHGRYRRHFAARRRPKRSQLRFASCRCRCTFARMTPTYPCSSNATCTLPGRWQACSSRAKPASAR